MKKLILFYALILSFNATPVKANESTHDARPLDILGVVIAPSLYLAGSFDCLPTRSKDGSKPCMASATALQVTTTVGTTLLLLLKTEDMNQLLEKAEVEGVVSEELRSIIKSIKEIYHASDLEISEDQILVDLYKLYN